MPRKHIETGKVINYDVMSKNTLKLHMDTSQPIEQNILLWILQDSNSAEYPGISKQNILLNRLA